MSGNFTDKQPLLVPIPNAGYPPPDYNEGHPPPSYGGYQGGYQAAPPPQQPRYDYAPKVITTQPHHTTRVYNEPSDNYLMLSIFLTVCCCICGSWVALCCTIPAIIAAASAREAEIVGDMEKTRSSRANALALNIVGFIFGLLGTIAAWVILYFRVLKNIHQESDPGY